MQQYGEPPYLECSSRGDRRFSAFHARLHAYGGRSIEEVYQAAKVFETPNMRITGLSWREAKGRQPTNAEEVRALYSRLWDQYIVENPDLIPVLTQASGLSDVFGHAGHACQAEELWRIREEALHGARI